VALEPLLRHILPPAHQWIGNRDRLLDLALAVLTQNDRLVFLAPAQINDGPRGSAAVFLTSTDVVVVEVDENFLIVGEIRFPIAWSEEPRSSPPCPVCRRRAHDCGRYGATAGLLPRPGKAKFADRLRP
jgi:hypothetical protein